MEMEARVLGIKHLNFKDDDGNPVKGFQIWLSMPTDDAKWHFGIEVCKVWVPEASTQAEWCQYLQIDEKVRVAFGRRGKLIIIDAVK